MGLIDKAFQFFMPINASGGSRGKSEFNLEDFLARTPTVAWGDKGQAQTANADYGAAEGQQTDPWLDKKYGYDPTGQDTVQQGIAGNMAKGKYDTEQQQIAQAAAEKKAAEAAAAAAAAEAAKQAKIQQTPIATGANAGYTPAQLNTTTPWERDMAAKAAASGVADFWGTTSPESRKAAYDSEQAYAGYKWKGQEWNDPLAKQVYQQFNPKSFEPRQAYGGKTFYDTVLAQAQTYNPGVKPASTTYNTFISPTSWGSTYNGDTYTKMKAEYIKQGGLAYGPKSPYAK